MAFEDDEAPLERVYPYRTSLTAFGCGFVACAAIGAAGMMLVPMCCEQWRNGNVAFGPLAVMGAPCTAFAVLMAVVAILAGLKEAIRPPLLRVTTASLVLPESARGQALEKDARGNPKRDGPHTHPEEVPFTTIRWVRREADTGTGAGRDKLMIVHDSSPVTLELQQSMMRAADFDELEAVLRAAVPEAFAALPTPPPPPRPTDGA
jgi:hypothetical protein